MDTVTTRRASASDSAALAEVAYASYLPYVARMGGQRPAPMDADYAASIARDVVWVAEVGGHVAGFLVLLDQPDITLLENVAVHPDWQGRGVGRLLIAIGEDHAKANGKRTVRLYTNAAMTENRSLYAHLGYVEMGQRVDDGFDRVFFEKTITVRGEEAMTATGVLDLFRQAMTTNDAAVMRQGVEQLFGLTEGAGLSAGEEYLVRHPDYVMEMPQTQERVRGRDAMRSMQETFPVPPQLTLRRVFGSGHLWVIEGVNDYEGDIWNVVVIWELDDEGLIRRDTRYYAQRSEPPEWRSQWVEPLD